MNVKSVTENLWMSSLSLRTCECQVRHWEPVNHPCGSFIAEGHSSLEITRRCGSFVREDHLSLDITHPLGSFIPGNYSFLGIVDMENSISLSRLTGHDLACTVPGFLQPSGVARPRPTQARASATNMAVSQNVSGWFWHIQLKHDKLAHNSRPK